MRYTIITLLCLFTMSAHAAPQTKVKCIEGYKYVIAYDTVGHPAISITQMFKCGANNAHPPQPIKCGRNQ